MNPHVQRCNHCNCHDYLLHDFEPNNCRSNIPNEEFDFRSNKYKNVPNEEFRPHDRRRIIPNEEFGPNNCRRNIPDGDFEIEQNYRRNIPNEDFGPHNCKINDFESYYPKEQSPIKCNPSCEQNLPINEPCYREFMVTDGYLLDYLLRFYRLDKEKLIISIKKSKEKEFKMGIIDNFYCQNRHLWNRPFPEHLRAFSKFSYCGPIIDPEDLESYYEEFIRNE